MARSSTLTLLQTAELPTNDPRRDPCDYQACEQLATHEFRSYSPSLNAFGARTPLCPTHAREFADAWHLPFEWRT